MNELITLEQLPIIKYKLEQLSVEIKEKVDNVTNLVVNEETVKDTKKVRTELKKEFDELETQRKTIKTAIMAKYDEFEEVYKENVSNLYKQADADLKAKIDSVESQLKLDKEMELRTFAEQWFISKGIETIVKFEDIKLNITMSASMKSLKEQIINFCEKIFSEIQLIELEEYKEEIMFEYKKNLDLTKSKIEVINRHLEIDKIKENNEILSEKKKAEQEMINKIEEVVATPVEIDETIYTAVFTVKTTKDKLKLLKKFMEENGIDYE